MKIGLGQFNAIVGDLDGNVQKMRNIYSDALRKGVELLVFPEMAICGYPPEDLILKKHFMSENLQSVENLAKNCPNITIITGFAEAIDDKRYNSLAFLQDGKIKGIYRKGQLPNYGVFDEKRYFTPDGKAQIFNIAGINIVPTICEDIWELDELDKAIANLTDKHLIINISASPFHAGKITEKQLILSNCAKHFSTPLTYCNLVGGQDEIVFDGRSMISNQDGKIIAQAAGFKEDLLIADINIDSYEKINITPEIPTNIDQKDNELQEIYNALVLGTRDYITKNGFKKALIGISGGIDSAIVAKIAADALGPENVVAVTMPSKFNSNETISDAQKVAENLKIEFHSIPISKILDSFCQMLKIAPGWKDEGIAYENLQARIRGTILMSMSNMSGNIVLTTGNKSETAVGYSTLYGDSAGGFAVIKDVPKTIVYRLCRYINELAGKEIIPESIITRPPSAELKDDQKDSDSLPDYDLLDAILKEYVELRHSTKDIIDNGFDADTVKKVVTMVDRNEYKRRQSPPGVKITPMAFGKDRRMPITNRFCHK